MRKWKRSAGQQLIPVSFREDFICLIDEGLKRLGYSNRSQFIREATWEKLGIEGRKLPLAICQAPSRAGKGGRPRKDKGRRR